MAHAGTMHGVIQAEEIALNIADGEQAIDGLVFFRAHLGIVIHMQAESESAPIPLTPLRRVRAVFVCGPIGLFDSFQIEPHPFQAPKLRQ